MSKHATPAAERLTPRELYLQCEQKAREVTPATIHKLLMDALLRFTFSFRPSEFDREILQSDSTDQKNAKLIWRGVKYEDVVKELRRAKDPRRIRLILACWGHYEHAFNAGQVFPEDCEREFRKTFKGLREKDQYYLAVLHAWLPYFERLQQDRQDLAKTRRLREELEKMGYNRDEISAAFVHRDSPAEAAAEWLRQIHGKKSAASFLNPRSKHASALQRLNRDSPEIFKRLFEKELDELKRRNRKIP